MVFKRMVKDPSESLDYKFAWGVLPADETPPGNRQPWLREGESITAHTVTSSPVGLTVESSEPVDDAQNVLVWISGGTAGTSYAVTCEITTSASRTGVRSMTLSIEDR